VAAKSVGIFFCGWRRRVASFFHLASTPLRLERGAKPTSAGALSPSAPYRVLGTAEQRERARAGYDDSAVAETQQRERESVTSTSLRHA